VINVGLLFEAERELALVAVRLVCVSSRTIASDAFRLKNIGLDLIESVTWAPILKFLFT